MSKPVKPVQTGRPAPRVVPWNGTGKVILGVNTRSSEGNEGKFVGPRNIDDILKAMEANRKLRDLAAKRPYHPHLKDLFGGG